MTQPLKIVAIIGCPNVGKSTLFNRIIGRKKAVTSEIPGVTRDRHYAPFTWQGTSFLLVDTGGYIPAAKEGIEASVLRQTDEAITEADLILFMVDGKVGITKEDQEARNLLVRSGKRVLLVVSKIDTGRQESELASFFRLGLGEPVGVSGLSGRGMGDMLDVVVEGLPETPSPAEVEDDGIPIAIVGRPNVGKSSFANALLGSDRHIVHENAGTTRDAVDSTLSFEGERVLLIDTAGLKRVVKIKDSVEYYSFLRTLRTIDRCDVAVVLFDVSMGLISGDIRIMSDVVQAGKGLVVAANKWDLVAKDGRTASTIEEIIRERIPDKKSYPIIFISALNRKRVEKALKIALEIHKNRNMRIPTPQLNEFMRSVSPPSGSSRVKIYYAVQSAATPPEFVFFTNLPGKVRSNYTRYLERSIRDAFGFMGTPIRIVFKQKQ